MTDAVETMAYSGEVPWHGFGNPVTNNLTPKQMCKKAGCDWTVEKKQLQFEGPNGEMLSAKDKFGLVRSSDQRVLSVVGSSYTPIQNEVAFDFFTKFVKAGHMTMETAGSLHDGAFVWALARLSKDFTLGKDDEVRGFLLFSQPHAVGHAMVIQFTPIRVVCWNTLTFALGNSLKGKGTGFKMAHRMEFDEAMRAKAEQALGLGETQMTEFKEAATLLSKKKAKPEEVESFFCEVLEYDPKKAKAKQDGEARAHPTLTRFQHALTHAPGQELPTALGTWWGALNAVTYVTDHVQGKGERDKTLAAAWFWNKASLKRRALNLAIEKAK